MGFSLGNAIGAVTGGILGGSDASSGPAGTTTKTNVQDVPDWLKPYFTSNLTGGSALRDSLTSGVNPLYGMSDAELAKTISGDYLDPESNPYLSKTGDIIAGKIGRTVDSRFESAGRYGSGAHQDVLATDVGNALNALYGANYASERGRQLATATGVPGYLSGEVAAKFAPYLNFQRLIPGLTSTTSTEPYFTNKGAGILGGALAGSQLGGMFGGFDLGSIFGGGAAAAGAGAAGAGAAGSGAAGAGAAEAGIADLLPYLATLA